jgi:hypothetical protein
VGAGDTKTHAIDLEWVAAQLQYYWPQANPEGWITEVPARITKAYLRQMPRLLAALSLRESSAINIGMAGRGGQTQRKQWLSIMEGKDPTVNMGLSALIKMKQANERARADGTLWDLHANGVEVVDVGGSP